MPAKVAQESYGRLLDPKDGFLRDAHINLPGLRTVLRLRSRYAQGAKKLGEPLKYYDPSYYDSAMHSRAADR
jgi:hypothetical protein